jgi:hypothetical protein
MSEQSRQVLGGGDGRAITEAERVLVAGLLAACPRSQALVEQLAGARVVDADNGGMGGFAFMSPRTDRVFGETAAEATFVDADGVLGVLQVNLDDSGDLLELDIWKSDFSPLTRLPTPSECKWSHSA